MKILEPLESLLNRMQSHELQDMDDPAEREASKRVASARLSDEALGRLKSERGSVGMPKL